jgi:hypothetical protein
MTPPTRTTIDRLADAGSLVGVIAAADFPRGMSVVNDRLPAGTLAVSSGSGLTVARLYRLPAGRAAVIVDARRVDGWDAARLDALILHESAHAIADVELPGVESALDAMPPAVEREPGRELNGHRPTWAAAFSILCQRAATYRRHHAALAAYVARDLAGYGYDAADLERLTAGVSHDAGLRDLLAAGTPGALLLEMRTPDVDSRMAAMVASGKYGWATSKGVTT